MRVAPQWRSTKPSSHALFEYKIDYCTFICIVHVLFVFLGGLSLQYLSLYDNCVNFEKCETNLRVINILFSLI